MKKQTAQVGASILYFQSGASAPLAGTIASVDADGRVNIAFTDTSGQAQSRQGVSVADEANADGDYVLIGDDAEGATKAHAAAAQKAQQGQPGEGQPQQTAAQKKAAAEAQQRGDFTSAAHAGDNKQPAGSGGPFDPANSSKAHMTVNQTQESQSAGNPTTGGVTPKLSAENMPMLSERDREAAQAIINAKTDREKTLAANAGTGAATRGTAEAIVKGQDPKGTPQAANTAGQAPAVPQQAPVVNQEDARMAQEEAKHKAAVEQSAKIASERKVAEQPAAKKVSAKTVAAKKIAAKAVKGRCTSGEHPCRASPSQAPRARPSHRPTNLRFRRARCTRRPRAIHSALGRARAATSSGHGTRRKKPRQAVASRSSCTPCASTPTRAGTSAGT